MASNNKSGEEHKVKEWNMWRFLSNEGLLLALAILPTVASSLLLLSPHETARRFIESQLVGNTIYMVLSFGIGITISSQKVPPESEVGNRIKQLPIIGFLLVMAVAFAFQSKIVLSAGLIAMTYYLSVLYRIPGLLGLSRAVNVLQFLALDNSFGVVLLMLISGLIIYHLNSLGVFSVCSKAKISNSQILFAWLSAVIKEVFFRGHYIILSSIGIVDSNYAVFLKYIDTLSRPTDYAFQRFVDKGLIYKISSLVLIVSIIMGGAASILAKTVPSLKQDRAFNLTYLGLVCGLTVFLKYLSYLMNNELRHKELGFAYLLSMFAALTYFLIPQLPHNPFNFMILSQVGCILVLLGPCNLYGVFKGYANEH